MSAAPVLRWRLLSLSLTAFTLIVLSLVLGFEGTLSFPSYAVDKAASAGCLAGVALFVGLFSAAAARGFRSFLTRTLFAAAAALIAVAGLFLALHALNYGDWQFWSLRAVLSELLFGYWWTVAVGIGLLVLQVWKHGAEARSRESFLARYPAAQLPLLTWCLESTQNHWRLYHSTIHRPETWIQFLALHVLAACAGLVMAVVFVAGLSRWERQLDRGWYVVLIGIATVFTDWALSLSVFAHLLGLEK